MGSRELGQVVTKAMGARGPARPWLLSSGSGLQGTCSWSQGI